MVPQNRLTIELFVFLLGVGFLIAGNISSNSIVATIGVLIMAIDVVIYPIELKKVFRF